MLFPYGRAPLAILLLAILSGGGLMLAHMLGSSEAHPDIVFATFTKDHAEAYKPAIEAFERAHGVKIQLQVVDQRALQGRLQSALQVGAQVPDMVELLDGTMGIFTKGPLADVGFVDLTERVHSEGLYDKLVRSRFGKWSSRGRIFALPHDVHPTMLCYRRDVAEKLGIDVSQLTTWEKFAEVGRSLTRDVNGDGVIDHYMIDLPSGEPWAARLLVIQNGGRMFDEAGEVAFDSEATLDVFCWYVHQVWGDSKTAFGAGWGQTLAKSMLDGLCVFYICPDWRTNQFEHDVPKLGGKLALIPMPAWTEGGIRTSTWGGTGLAFTRQCEREGKFELAWKLAMHLYYDPEQLGPRFAKTNILPPYRPAWNLPQIDENREFFSSQAIGREYARLGDQVPNEQAHAYMSTAEGKFLEAFSNTLLYFKEHGDDGLRDYARAELKRCADAVRRVIRRNAFLSQPEPAPARAVPQ